MKNRDSIEKCLDNIASVLLKQSYQVSNIGIAEGKMGMILFLLFYAKYSQNQNMKAQGEELLVALSEEINEKTPVNYWDGLLGFGTAVEYLVGHRNTFFIKMKFDAVFDPFFDLYFEKLMPFMNFGGRYVFCGFYNQHSSFGFEEHTKSLYPLITKCITSNISLIGNCLGRKEDLVEAVSDYLNKYYTPQIDSVYTEDAILDFFTKLFVSKRLGKVVYKYKN